MRLCSWLSCCGLFLFVVGCGDGEGLVPAEGTVTLDGTPLPGAKVDFVPQSAEGIPATAETNAEGKFEIRTPQGKRGTKPGSYKVVVTKKNLPPGYNPDQGAYDPNELKELVPLPYSDPEKTTLTATVEPGKTLDFALTGSKKK